MSEHQFERVASMDDLPEGTPTSVDLSKDESVCLIRVGSEVFAVSNNCTHADFPMSDGEMVEDFVIECGLHGAQFDVRDGAAVELPATEPLRCFEVKIDDGQVLIRKPG